MACKIKCMYYSEDCAEYCKYAAILSSEIPYAKMVKEARGIYLNGNEYGSGESIYD